MSQILITEKQLKRLSHLILKEQDIDIGENQQISLNCITYNEKGEEKGKLDIQGKITNADKTSNGVSYFLVQRPKSLNDGPWSGGGDSGGQSYNVFIEPIVEDSLITQLGVGEAGNKILTHWLRNNSNQPKHYCEVIKDETSSDFIQELVKNGVHV